MKACVRIWGDNILDHMNAMLLELEQALKYVYFRQFSVANARKPGLMAARLRVYTRQTSELAPDWCCFVCLGPEEDVPGGVVKINRCSHQLHFNCLLRGVLERPGNNRLCPYCNQSFDGLPNETWVDNRLRGELEVPTEG
jgi:hypothetical protein